MNKTDKNSKRKTRIVKILSIFILTIYCLSLVGCDPNSYYFTAKYLSDGKVVEFIGCFCDSGYFISLVNDYFQTKI